VFHARAIDVVRLSQRPVWVYPDFGYDKEADPLGPGRGTFNASQQQVDDVFRQVLLSRCNEAFGSIDPVYAGILGFGIGYEIGRASCRERV